MIFTKPLLLRRPQLAAVLAALPTAAWAQLPPRSQPGRPQLHP